MRSVLSVPWKDWCWSWNSSTLTTSCKELTHWKRLGCWEGLGAGGEGDNWGWDGWLVSPTRWTWVWVNSESWWWTGRPGVLRFMGSQSWTQLSDWTELNWTTLSNSGKLWAMPCRATQDGWVMVESSDKMWSTGEGNGKTLLYSYFKNPMNSPKRGKSYDTKSCSLAGHKF